MNEKRLALLLALVFTVAFAVGASRAHCLRCSRHKCVSAAFCGEGCFCTGNDHAPGECWPGRRK